MMPIFTQFAIISVLFQCIQGNMIDHFKSERDSASETFEDQFMDHEFLKIHNGAAVDTPLNLPRVRRQGGNNPYAYSNRFTGDDSDYSRTIYSLGEGSEVVYLLTYDKEKIQSRDHVTSSRLYRSINHGRTYSSQSYKFPRGSLLDSLVYRFPNSRAAIFVDARKLTIYVTTNDGLTFGAYNVTVNPWTMKVHPTTPGWLLGHDPDQGAIMYSQDYGASWAIVARNVHPSDYTRYSNRDFVWGRPGIDWDVNNPRQSDITKVFYTVYDSSVTSVNNRILYIANNPGIGYVNRVFDSNLGYIIYFYVSTGDYIYAQRIISINGERELYVSYMRNPFNLARIPNTSSHYSYLYGSYRSSQSLLVVEHDSVYNLYMSDKTGTYYTLSLGDLVGENYRVDLTFFNSINGTMIANQFVMANGQRHNQTLITFDNGATWQKIAAPATSYCRLQSTCSLHFHMDTSTTYGHIDVYSTTSAPGIIVAHGNVGSYLTNTVSTYITRDGGLTWEQTLYGSWHIEIIDHGGLLVAAKQYSRTDPLSRSIKYSCNEGTSWNDFAFSTTSLVVLNTHTEPGETTTRVLLIGIRGTSTSYYWAVVHIDFTSVFLRTCQSLDYYHWTVSDGRAGNQQCLLGETRIIERRRASVCCWNGRQYERLISTSPCQCTAADFECEWRYYRDNSGNCVWNDKYGLESECSTRYRKIPGDACIGGVSSQYLTPHCDDTTTSSTGNTGTGTRTNDSPTDGGDNGSSSSSSSQGSSDDDDSSGNDNNIVIIAVIVVVVILVGVAFIIGIVIFVMKQHKVDHTTTTPTNDHRPIVVVNSGQMSGTNITSVN